jgi:hypothetical protein
VLPACSWLGRHHSCMPGQVTCACLAKVFGAARERLLQPYCTVYMHRDVLAAAPLALARVLCCAHQSVGLVARLARPVAGAVQLFEVLLQVLQHVTISAPSQRAAITLLAMHQALVTGQTATYVLLHTLHYFTCSTQTRVGTPSRSQREAHACIPDKSANCIVVADVAKGTVKSRSM